MVTTHNRSDKLAGQVAGLKHHMAKPVRPKTRHCVARGENSLTADNAPLVGIGWYPPLAALPGDIDPNIIENMSVLKDAFGSDLRFTWFERCYPDPD